MREFTAELVAVGLMALGVISIALAFTLPQLCLVTSLCPVPDRWPFLFPFGIGLGLIATGLVTHPKIARVQ